MEALVNFSLVMWIMIFIRNSFQDKISSKVDADFDELHESSHDYSRLLDEERLIEHELEIKENRFQRKAFPTTCHVCRLFITELHSFLQENNALDEEEDGATLSKNGNIIYRALNEVCQSMKNYRVTRIRPFRYIRGGSTPIREMFKAAQKNSRVKNWIYNVPESELDDPTGEIQLLETKCEELVQREEDRIVKWFFQDQRSTSYEWLCRDGSYVKDNKACFTESLEIKPEFMQKMEESLAKRKHNGEIRDKEIKF